MSVNLSLIIFKVSVFSELVCPNKSKLGFKFLIIFTILLSILEKVFCCKKNLSLKLIVWNLSFINPFEILVAKLILVNLKLFFSSKLAICRILLLLLLI